MAKFSFLLPFASSLLGLVMNKKQKINIPAAELPPTPAPAAMQDTGASVALGYGGEDVKNQRVSGRSAKRSGAGVDILGGLGASGLKI